MVDIEHWLLCGEIKPMVSTPEQERKKARRELWCDLKCFGILLIVLIVLIVGIFTSIRWLLHILCLL